MSSRKACGVRRIEDDAEFLEKILEGDVDTFRLFFRERSPEVIALCKRILGSSQDAEDITADVFLEVWTRRERFDRNRGSLRTYVLLLARSRAIDLYRVKAKERLRVEPADRASIESASRGHAVDESPHADVSFKELQQNAQNALAEIGEHERTAIELAFYGGLSHAQIATKLDSPLGTVKSNIRRGLAKLKQKLKQWES